MKPRQMCSLSTDRIGHTGLRHQYKLWRARFSMGRTYAVRIPVKARRSAPARWTKRERGETRDLFEGALDAHRADASWPL